MKLNFEKNKGRLDPNIKKYLTGEYTERYTGRVIKYDKRTPFEKGADKISETPKGKPTDVSGRYKEYPPQAEDPLVVGTERYGNYSQDENMVPVAEIEDQNFGQENDPEKTFVPVEEIVDQDSLDNHDFEIENSDVDTGNEEIDENGDSMVQEHVEKKDPREVLINGVPLGKIMDDEIFEEELPKIPADDIPETPLDFSKIEKTSVNRGHKTKKDLFEEEYGKKGQAHKTKRKRRSLAAKIAKKHKEKTWQEFPVENRTSGSPKRESSNISEKDLKKSFKHGKDLGDYEKTA